MIAAATCGRAAGAFPHRSTRKAVHDGKGGAAGNADINFHIEFGSGHCDLSLAAKKKARGYRVSTHLFSSFKEGIVPIDRRCLCGGNSLLYHSKNYGITGL